MPKISYLAKLEFFIVSLLAILFMTLNKIENAFFELLRIALGTQEKMTVALNDAEWKDVAQMAVKQSVLGILFTAVETLPEEQRPYNDLYIDMYKWVDTIEQRNEHMNKLTASVSNRFRKDGFPNCILKGQGVALLYPKPLRRHSGDVDVWLKGKRKDIIKYVKKIPSAEKAEYLHIGFKLNKKDVIEVHFRPSCAFNPIVNHRLEKWFADKQDEQNNHIVTIPNTEYKIPVPTIEFNVIFILHHIYRHFFNEGIGIRQLIDYFYVIKACDTLEESVKNRITHSLSQFGLDKFSRSIFWILRELFGMNTDNYFMADCDEEGGTQVLNEILITGNMGYGDPNRKTKRFDRITHRYKRLANFIVNYPSEILLRHPFLAYQNVKMYFTDN